MDRKDILTVTLWKGVRAVTVTSRLKYKLIMRRKIRLTNV